MRILHIIATLTVGGAERFLHSLLSSELADNTENHVICLSNMGYFDSRLKAMNIPVTCLKMPHGKPPLSGLKVLRKKIIQRRCYSGMNVSWQFNGFNWQNTGLK